MTKGLAIEELLPHLTIFLAGMWMRLREVRTCGRLDYICGFAGGFGGINNVFVFAGR
jgi:hypothetical protein